MSKLKIFYVSTVTFVITLGATLGLIVWADHSSRTRISEPLVSHEIFVWIVLAVWAVSFLIAGMIASTHEDEAS